jgi:hypothetical protein
MSKRVFKRLATLAVTASIAISAIRVLVLFFESYSRVAAERSADYRLLKLCGEEESAAASGKFQAACVSARAEGAAPILLKSLLHAFHTALGDTLELFNSPARVAAVVLLLMSGVSAPLFRVLFLTLVAGLRTRHEEEADEEEDAHRAIVHIDPFCDDRGSAWARVRGSVRHRLCLKTHSD